jgi:O-antigen ligase
LFYNLQLTIHQLRTLMLILAGSLVSVATIALTGILTTPVIAWGNESNAAASGGYGPNQVSTSLGLGALALWVAVLLLPARHKLLFGLVSLWLLIQAMLTFSRGGAIAALIPLLVITIYITLRHRDLLRPILPLVVVTLLLASLVFPFVDAATNHMLSARFSDPNTTHRTEIAAAHWQLFLDNPIWGVGVGVAKGRGTGIPGLTAAAHTEFTRLVAEHGMLGLLAIGLLSVALVRNVGDRNQSSYSRMVALAAVVWSFLYMTNAGMRTVAPSFMIGLSFVTLLPADGPHSPTDDLEKP